MTAGNIYRRDQTNVGDWYCAPSRYFAFPDAEGDILHIESLPLAQHVIVGGGGLVAKTFHPLMEKLAARKPEIRSLVAWGIGESENVDKTGKIVHPYDGAYPAYLNEFDLVGVRDFGTNYRWVPCVSCMSELFDLEYPVTTDICVYEHKRIPLGISGFPTISNSGDDLQAVLRFLGSAHLVITNSYHGAYWATLLGRRVIVIPSMSKLYRFAHAPVICTATEWSRYVGVTQQYPNALTESRAANLAFHKDVLALQAMT
ncbi:polysaccharide pyruvyl transferase family protein [Rhizobium sp. Leaf341]|uniref:polysaccharide pyruvyl transferase family protein n=1 Tax=Rhizobium sp. Leaf341 TaxID=1736344 RepID=UPI0007131CBA|nr:polysaccharide pyruvyl transferase family protein [Rhizobium sp. Leaf341]KQR69062.1 hypothetical protein ASG03_07540 [Rhizobium sp. Leaf341]